MAGSVMIVDDSAAVRDVLVRLFSEGGFEVCGVAGNGLEAIEKAPGLNPGLIVMDISMPVMNGIEAARIFKQILPNVPVIMLSDYGVLFPEHDAGSIGMAAVVSKAECTSALLYAARALLSQTAA
jgi:two-component system, chemotaxis family, chemotaxis protein CheY